MQPNKLANDILLWFFRKVGLASSNQLKLVNRSKKTRRPVMGIRIFIWLRSFIPKRAKPLLLADLRDISLRIADDMEAAAARDIAAAVRKSLADANVKTFSAEVDSLDGLQVAMKRVHELAEGCDPEVTEDAEVKTSAPEVLVVAVSVSSKTAVEEQAPTDASTTNHAEPDSNAVAEESAKAKADAQPDAASSVPANTAPKDKVETPEPEAPKAEKPETIQANSDTPPAKARKTISKSFDELMRDTDFTLPKKRDSLFQKPELTDAEKYPEPVFRQPRQVSIVTGELLP